MNFVINEIKLLKLQGLDSDLFLDFVYSSLSFVAYVVVVINVYYVFILK